MKKIICVVDVKVADRGRRIVNLECFADALRLECVSGWIRRLIRGHNFQAIEAVRHVGGAPGIKPLHNAALEQGPLLFTFTLAIDGKGQIVTVVVMGVPEDTLKALVDGALEIVRRGGRDYSENGRARAASRMTPAIRGAPPPLAKTARH
jgi:hypothetical protein